MVIEFVYITKYYICGCVTCMPVRPPRLEREVYPQMRCPACQYKYDQDDAREKALLKEKAGAGMRYIVDGQAMTIYQHKGSWLGRRYESHKQITKSFGKIDPRPQLEEAWY